MKIKTNIILLSCILFSFQILSAQHITFYPESDTIKVIDGCTGSVIICSLMSSSVLDSIIISPGDNTNLEYIDSLGHWRSTKNCYFLVADSSDEFEYELWYYPLGSLPYFQSIPFDSSFYTVDYLFEINLVVKSQGIHIDSLDQLFTAEYGLGIDEVNSGIPQYLGLYSSYPNPFNSSTTIQYYLPKSSNVNISIYDISGQLIETVLNDRQISGFHTINWNAQNIHSGVYFIHLSSDGNSKVNKCLLLK